MAFIKTLPASDVGGDVLAMYARQEAHWGFVPNYARVFCHRPEIMGLWAQLQAGIKRHMDKRRFELVTFVAAHELRSTLCSLAHGKALTEFFSVDDVLAMARSEAPASLLPGEAAMLAFSRLVARDASSVTAEDVTRLQQHGFTDAEIFDIAATAAGRAFFSKLVESLGVEAEPLFREMSDELKSALVVGRPVDFAENQAHAAT
ncbi:MAG: peroxidase [Gammaproteobacteria bacterium]